MWSSHTYHEPSATLLVIITSFLYFLNLFGWIAQNLVSAGLLGQILIGIIYGTPVAGWLGADFEEAIVGIGYVGLLIVVFEGMSSLMLVGGRVLIYRWNDYFAGRSTSDAPSVHLCRSHWTADAHRLILHPHARIRFPAHPRFRSWSSFVIYISRHYPHRPPTPCHRVRYSSIQTRRSPAKRSCNGRCRRFHFLKDPLRYWIGFDRRK
jgi:hypothetical protein